MISIYGGNLIEKINYSNKMLYYLCFTYLTYKSSGYIDEYFRSLYYFMVYKNKRKLVTSYFFNLVLKIPYYRNKLNREIMKVETTIKSDTLKLEKSVPNNFSSLKSGGKLELGFENEKILNKMKENAAADLTHHNPLKLSGTLYNTPSEKEKELLKGVMDLYYKTNPLHADIYPSLISMEKDIVSFTKNMFNCDDNSGHGTVTTGGTESIILALFGYREYAKKRKGITNPQVIAMSTVHPAFDKGCYYLGIELVKINVDNDNNIDIEQLSWAINHNTILIVGSVPSFPHGLIDDISVLNNVALRRNIPIHIDACLGGFLTPFINNEDEKYDFRLPGVQSISSDTHKYGCCPKGSSVLIFRDKDYFESCYFVQSEWSGGIYATTNITGSRSGLNLAWTWAVLSSLGYEKLKTNADKISAHIQTIKNAFINDTDIFIFGDPKVCAIGFGSNTINIYEVCEVMKHRGWNLNELQNPASFHLCITNCHTDEIIEKFIGDLKGAITNVVDGNSENITMSIEDSKVVVKKKEEKNKQSASIYGTTQRVPDQSIIDYIVRIYLNTLH